MTHPRLRGQQASGDLTTDRDISPEQVNTGLSTPPHLKTNQHNVFVFTLPLYPPFLDILRNLWKTVSSHIPLRSDLKI